MIKLPNPKHDSPVSVERAIAGRRSVRDFRDDPMEIAELAQLLWAAQGVTGPRGSRSIPSAGALYPLEVYVVAGEVTDLAEGAYRYDPGQHTLHKILDGDKRHDLAGAAFGQPWVGAGAALLAVSGVYERTTPRYGERGIRYVHMEAGHMAQNIQLQAESLELGTVCVGAFDDEHVSRILALPAQEVPLYLIPVGRK